MCSSGQRVPSEKCTYIPFLLCCVAIQISSSISMRASTFQPPRTLFIRVPLLAFPKKKIAPLPARNHSQNFVHLNPAESTRMEELPEYFTLGAIHIGHPSLSLNPAGLNFLVAMDFFPGNMRTRRRLHFFQSPGSWWAT